MKRFVSTNLRQFTQFKEKEEKEEKISLSLPRQTNLQNLVQQSSDHTLEYLIKGLYQWFNNKLSTAGDNTHGRSLKKKCTTHVYTTH